MVSLMGLEHGVIKFALMEFYVEGLGPLQTATRPGFSSNPYPAKEARIPAIPIVAPIARLVKDRLSDAGFESQAGRVTGKPTPSLWRDKHPAIKGLRPPEHCGRQFHLDHTYSSKSNKKGSNPHVDQCSNPLPWDPLSSLKHSPRASEAQTRARVRAGEAPSTV